VGVKENGKGDVRWYPQFLLFLLTSTPGYFHLMHGIGFSFDVPAFLRIVLQRRFHRELHSKNSTLGFSFLDFNGTSVVVDNLGRYGEP
jgi:hypothetical protein